MTLLISPVDATIIAAYLVATVVWGIWIGRRGRTTSDYFLGNHELPWWALLLSIVATETSTVTFLSVPGLSYGEGGNCGFLQLAAGYVIGRLLVAWLLLPHYFDGSLATSYELLETRLGAGTRRLSSLLFLASRTIGDALRLFLTALVLYRVIHLNLPLCIVIVGGASIVYTFAGGLKSVVWNDCLQFLIYITGAVWALCIMVQQIPGGWDSLWSFAREQHKLAVLDWNPSPLTRHLTVWVGLVGGAFLSWASHGTDHLIVQRLLGARSQSDARRALVLSGAVVFAQFALFLLIGIALACFYQQYPPAEAFENNDEVFASFIANQMHVGVVGIVLAAVFAAAMSTQSSSLNSSAAAAINDLYQPLCGPTASEAHLLRAGKAATILFGMLQIAVAVAAYRFAPPRSTVDNVLQIAAFAYGPVLGLFFLATLTRRVRPGSSFGAFAVGLTVIVVLKLVGLPEDSSFRVNGYWYTAIGSLVTLATGYGLEKLGQKWETGSR